MKGIRALDGDFKLEDGHIDCRLMVGVVGKGHFLLKGFDSVIDRYPFAGSEIWNFESISAWDEKPKTLRRDWLLWDEAIHGVGCSSKILVSH